MHRVVKAKYHSFDVVLVIGAIVPFNDVVAFDSLFGQWFCAERTEVYLMSLFV